MVTPVDIVNQVIHVVVDQIQDSPFTIILSISTLIVALGTIFGLWKTRESNKLFALEIRAKFNPTFEFRKRDIKKESDTNNNNLWKYSCYMWNVGNVSVSNILIYHYEYQPFIPIDEVLKHKNEITTTLFEKIDSTLEPNHEHFITFTLKRDINKPLRIVIWLEYEYLHYKAESIIFLDHNPDETTGYAWHDNDYIKNKRKELKI